MDKKLELKLVEKYPVIFQAYGGDIRKTCMGWGLSCGDGWFNLIDKLCEDITKLIDDKDIKVIALQVKEKFGGLRFYYYIDYKISPLNILDNRIAEIMASYRLGRNYRSFTNFRRRFFTTISEKISDLISEAECKSYTICETCGEPGETRDGGWVNTSCDSCDKKFSEGKRSWTGNWNDWNE